ncbi:MAG: hypothetical protein ACOYIH_08800 [Candidatus Fimadaptatus sp.]
MKGIIFMESWRILKAKAKRRDFSERFNAKNASQPFIAVAIVVNARCTLAI